MVPRSPRDGASPTGSLAARPPGLEVPMPKKSTSPVGTLRAARGPELPRVELPPRERMPRASSLSSSTYGSTISMVPRDQTCSVGKTLMPRLAQMTSMPGWSRSIRSTISGRPPDCCEVEYSLAMRLTMSSRTVGSGVSPHESDHFGSANAEGSA